MSEDKHESISINLQSYNRLLKACANLKLAIDGFQAEVHDSRLAKGWKEHEQVTVSMDSAVFKISSVVNSRLSQSNSKYNVLRTLQDLLCDYVAEVGPHFSLVSDYLSENSVSIPQNTYGMLSKETTEIAGDNYLKAYLTEIILIEERPQSRNSLQQRTDVFMSYVLDKFEHCQLPHNGNLDVLFLFSRDLRKVIGVAHTTLAHMEFISKNIKEWLYSVYQMFKQEIQDQENSIGFIDSHMSTNIVGSTKQAIIKDIARIVQEVIESSLSDKLHNINPATEKGLLNPPTESTPSKARTECRGLTNTVSNLGSHDFRTEDNNKIDDVSGNRIFNSSTSNDDSTTLEQPKRAHPNCKESNVECITQENARSVLHSLSALVSLTPTYKVSNSGPNLFHALCFFDEFEKKIIGEATAPSKKKARAHAAYVALKSDSLKPLVEASSYSTTFK